MICTNCFEAKYEAVEMPREVTVRGSKVILPDIECDKCPNCGEITFTHRQSLALDKKRISLEFGSIPILKPGQLKLFRILMDASLEQICDFLKIGKNTYGRWERGEIEITPSMNLLVHNFLDRFPEIKTNIIESERSAVLDKAKGVLLSQSLSLGTFLQGIIDRTNIRPSTICFHAGVNEEDLQAILHNDSNPEDISPIVFARIAKLISIDIDIIKKLLENALNSFHMKSQLSTVHARSDVYNRESETIRNKSLSKVIDALIRESDAFIQRRSISASYIDKLREAIEQIDMEQR